MAAKGKYEDIIEVYEDRGANMEPDQLPQAIAEIQPKDLATGCIYRVPSELRSKNESTYTPQQVSIGPYHFRANCNNPIPEIKVQALGDLLRRSGQPKDKYDDIASRRVEDVRGLYAEDIQLDDSDLVEMLVNDGCFIIEFFIKWYLNDDSIKTTEMRPVLRERRRDLLLVENQIPFFILDDFFNASTVTGLPDGVGLMELALAYLSGDRAGARVAVEEYSRNPKFKSIEFLHLLHLFHRVCLSPEFSKLVEKRSFNMRVKKLRSINFLLSAGFILIGLAGTCLLAVLSALTGLLAMFWWWFLFPLLYSLLMFFHFIQTGTKLIALRRQKLSAGIPNARYLRDTGFVFRKKKPLSSFSRVTRTGKTTIEIPALSMDLTPPDMLMNLIIFEDLWMKHDAPMDRSRPPCKRVGSVTGFAKLMFYLIDTAEDVAILKEHGIIAEGFGDDETMARSLNCLCEDISRDEQHYLESMFASVRGYYPRNHSRVMFYQWRKEHAGRYWAWRRNPLAVPPVAVPPVSGRAGGGGDIRETEVREMAAEGKSEVVIQLCAALPAICRIERNDPATANIFRVPSEVRSRNERSYTPQYVSIGPYHFNCDPNNPMHAIKMQALRDLLDREGRGGHVEQRLGKYVDIAFCRLDEVKKLYAEDVDHTDLVSMLVTDGCFIIEILVKSYLKDRCFNKSILPKIRRDLLLVENQVPFFILHEFFNASTIPGLPDGVGLMELALAYLSGDRVGARIAVEEYHRNPKFASIEFLHLLHLHHRVCLEPDFVRRVNYERAIDKHFLTDSILLKLGVSVLGLTWACLHAVLTVLIRVIWWSMIEAVMLLYVLMFLLATCLCGIRALPRHIAGRRNSPGRVPNARYLRETGFTFRKRRPLSRFSFVARTGMIIRIPELSMNDTSPAILRNLIIFEELWMKHHTSTQFSRKRGGVSFTSPLTNRRSVAGFMKLMGHLVHTAEDVALLRQYGIIDKRFGDDAKVARRLRTWSGLCQGIALDEDHYLTSMFDGVRVYYVRNHYRIMFYQWRKNLIPDYFSNPWAVPSMTAAVIALGLTSASTFYSIYHFYHPRS